MPTRRDRATAPSPRRRAGASLLPRQPGPPPALQQQLPCAAPVPRKRRGATPRKRRAAFPGFLALLAALPSAPLIQPTRAELRDLMVLAWTAVALADAEARWEAEARARAQAQAGGSSSPAGKKRSATSSSSASRHLAAAEEKPNAPPLAAVDNNPSMPIAPPRAAVDENLSMSMAPPLAAVDANPSMPMAPAVPAVDENPSVSMAPAAKKLCSAVPEASAAAGSSAMQLGDEDDELELGEIPPEKPAAAECNADSARESLLGKGKEMVGEETAAGGADALAVDKEKKKEREVFVGNLHRDAKQEDIKAALSVFGEITEVRMFMDEAKIKNKGFCFVGYREPTMARMAVAESTNVKICGKACRVEVPETTEKPKTSQKDPVTENPNRAYGKMQPSPRLADSSSITSWRPLAISPSSSYALPPIMPTPEHYFPQYPYGNNNVYLSAGPNYGLAQPWERSQMRQDSSGRSRQPKRSRK